MKSILTRHLLAFSNSFAQRFRFSSDAGTKWLAASMVMVRVAAYSGGVFVSRSPARPAVAPPTVLSTCRRLNPGCDVVAFCIDVFLIYLVTALRLLSVNAS